MLMNKVLLVMVLALTTAISASAAPEVLQDWVIDDGSTYNVYLHIQRTDLGTGIWRWEYSLDNGSIEALEQFSVGFQTDPTGHISNFGYILGGSPATATTLQTSSNLLWTFATDKIPVDPTFDSNALKTQATFVFDTDWQYVTLANHQARDGVVTPDWRMRAVPSPAIPEPMTLVLGIMGLGTVAGLGRLRRK